MARGALEATRPGQFSRISGLAAGGDCADAGALANSAIPAASVITKERRTAIRCSRARRSNTLARFRRAGHLTVVPSAHSKNAPLARGISTTNNYCRSARLGDDATRCDHDPATVLLADRVNAAKTRNVVARRNFHHAELGALDERRVAIDVAHRPAGQRRAHANLLRRRSWHRASGVLGRQRIDAPLDAIETLVEVRNLPGRAGAGRAGVVAAGIAAAGSGRALGIELEHRNVVLQLRDRAPYSACLIHQRWHRRRFSHLRELRVLQEPDGAERAAGGTDRDRNRDGRAAHDLLADGLGRTAVRALRRLLGSGLRGGCSARWRCAVGAVSHNRGPQ